jgi:hypothetical protein
MTFIRLFATFCLLSICLFGCQAQPSASTPIASPFASSTFTSPSPTYTAIATSMPTSRPPTATATATMTASPTVTVEPTANGQIGPNSYPDAVNPLTGLVVSDPTVLQRRPLAIKISNFPFCVRPQAGLGKADLVFEHYAEGGTTRFTAIFYSQEARLVGSVRSARLIDLEIPAMYDAMFAFSGVSDGGKKRFAAVDFFERIISPDFEPYHPAFWRRSGQNQCEAREHTLFTNTAKLWETTTNRNLNHAPHIQGIAFNATSPAGGQAAQTLAVKYMGSSVFWRYDTQKGLYRRSNDGSKQTDQLDGTAINAANIVVIFVNHVVTDIIEDFVGYNRVTKKGGHYGLELQWWGNGGAWVLRDGQRFEVRWQRLERNQPALLLTTDGHIFPLKPGVTWYQLVPLDSVTRLDKDSDWVVVPTSIADSPK